MNFPTDEAVPEPTVMPVDRRKWKRELNVSNFVNAYCQYRDLQSLPDVQRILIVGPGQGLEKQVLAARGYSVTTLDIDEEFSPDRVGSVHDMAMFGTGQFDAVIASHVLEHLAVPFLQPSLSELSRVGNHALVYLPVRGRHIQLRLKPGFGDVDWSFILDLFNYFERPDGVTPRYMQRMHFWEVGMRGFRVKDLRALFSSTFEIIRDYRNRDWLPSYNFVMRSRRQ